MKRKLFMLLPFLIGVISSMLWISCNSKEKSPTTKTDDCKYCDTTMYKRIYSKDGYVLLHAVSADSLTWKDIKSQRISDDTASRMVRYFIKRKMTGKQPLTIDFDYSSVNYLMTVLNSPNRPDDEKKGLRIYLSAYDTKMANDLHRGMTQAQRDNLDGYLTTILVGSYNGEEVTDAVNLGNICPPNCPDPPGSTPNPNKLKLLKLANGRTDIYN